MKQSILGAAILLSACNSNHFNNQMDMSYPITTKQDISEDYFGTQVADPYRWLEDDNSKETMEWVDAQNEVTDAYLNKIPFRGAIRERLEALWNYPKIGAPFKKSDRYFQYKNDGLQNQSVLYVKSSPEDEGRVLLDPNTLSDDGTISLSSMAISDDGKYMAYGISRGGSDWNEIYIRNIDSGEDLSDKIMWIKNQGVTWYKDGFYYGRFPQPADGDALKGENRNSKVYYHALGTTQKEDQLVYEDPKHPDWTFAPEIIDGTDFLALWVYESTSGNALFVKNMKNRSAKWTKLVDNFEKDYSIISEYNGKLLINTNDNAPKYRIIAIDPNQPQPENWVEVVPEKEETLVGTKLMGGTLLLEYLKDAHSVVYAYTPDGTFLHEVEIPGIGSVGNFSGEKEDEEAFYTFTSFTTPGTIYKYNIKENTSELFHKSEINFDTEAYETNQVFYTSKDGTKVPMFIIHKKGLELDGNRPTLLYGYGGFNISLTPSFSTTRLTWLENNGVVAIANLRGGGEYGEAWHKAGTLMQKQNVFDDCIAAAEYLIAENYTSNKRLAIQGGSNGGLLVGAVVNQRPDLFAVAFPAVGVMDMLRYHKFTIGRYWATDYGTSEDNKEMFDYLYAYSPVHNVKADTHYPAIMVTTADHDDRVVPAHSFKYAAALQENAFDTTPRLIRIDKNAGHGAGKPTSMVIDSYADLWAYAFFNMNVTPVNFQ